MTELIARRDVAQWLVCALAGLRTGELFAETTARGAPVRRQRKAEPVKFVDGATLRGMIRSAPEEFPGQPGLYAVRLSGMGQYPVIGIRRTKATQSEVHADLTDVWFVLEGAGTLVTGGTVVGGVETAPKEVRGRSIEGGERRRVRAGDFAIVPAGVPHWISRVEKGELLYLVVKVPLKEHSS